MVVGDAMSEQLRSWQTQWMLVGVLVIGAFLTALNATLMSPLLVGIARQFRVSDSAAGQLVTIGSTFAGLTALGAVPFASRYSHMALLRFEVALLGGGTLLSVISPNFWCLAIGRAIAGIGGAAIFGICLAAVGERFSDADERNKVIGIVGTAGTLGSILGLPVMTQIMALTDWRWAMAVVIPLSVIVFIGTTQVPGSIRRESQPTAWNWTAGYRELLGQSSTIWLLAAMIISCMCWSGWLVYFAAYTENVFDVGANQLSLMYLLGGASSVLGNIVLPGVIRRTSTLGVVMTSLAVLSLTLLAASLIVTASWMLFVFILIANGFSVMVYTGISILLLESLPEAQTVVMTAQAASFELGWLLGAAVTGAALSVLGSYRNVFGMLGLVLPIAIICLVASARAGTVMDAPELASSTG
jgi:DHA1 family inner membrane transport protein